ncbi:glycogen debranching protein [Cellulosilyticum sp. I15G10I2]|uniref:glycogen debranching protein n=1 Tax=Cellulosilyticum sp. I15G10I2 TaxID=1892843 RepID=UPI00085C5C82|nr:alpha-amylase family glycosyl hydrolase [Cellulosilyticum sp. I15G10I2]
MYNVKKGIPLLGCSLDSNGANFGIFSNSAHNIVLEIYHSFKEKIPVFKIILDKMHYATGDIFHIYVEDIEEGMSYVWKIMDSAHELSKPILDPYAYCIEEDPCYPLTYRNGIVHKLYSESRKPSIPWEETILYEMHVGSFTKDISANMEEVKRGTYTGLIDKLPYLKQLGITTLELLPVFKWNPYTLRNRHPVTGKLLQDVWGYNTIAFFALDEKYSIDKDGFQVIQEFKQFIEAAHRLDLEVILDVVYNHTGEGGIGGKSFNFKYLSNNIYYKFDENNEYANHSGTGNTLNTNHYVVKQLILDSLRYWVTCMGVDGFRFDLASILGQDQYGKWMNHSVLNDISQDPILSHVKLISESWDAKGSYDVGRMPYHFREWSDYFRDTIRKFIRGDQGLTKSVADCMVGKEIYFSDAKKNNTHAVHFITAHDGFTMWDLLSYESKHNFENGEENRDGHNANYSCNCGVEGETSDVQILNMRKRRVKNYMCLLLLSKGIPMLLMGDEFCRTQKGNNNAYCQDNDIVWVDWERQKRFEDIFTFTKDLIKLRKTLKYFNHKKNNNYVVTWHGVYYNKPDWSYYSRSIACHIKGEKESIFIVANSYHEPLIFELPPSETKWLRVVDTNLTSPKDADIIGQKIESSHYQVECYSICVFLEG